jgi:hypothetical protein
MAGLGGAIDPALAIGDVVIDGQSTLPVPTGHWRRGEICTTPDLVATVAQKHALFAASGALVADLENAIAREFAARHGIPFLGIRAVSDDAGERLDPATLRWIDATGRLRPARLAADLFRRPATIPALWRLGRRSRVAVRNLAEAVRMIVCALDAASEPPTDAHARPCRSTA